MRALYLAHAGEPMSLTSMDVWDEMIAEDIVTLRKAGLEHAAFADVLAAQTARAVPSRREVDLLNAEICRLDAQGKYARPFRLPSGMSLWPATGMARSTGSSPPPLPGWPGSTTPRAATPRPSRSTSARWPSARRRWAPTTPTSAPASTTWPSCTATQGRYAEAEPLYKRGARHRREGAGARPPRRRHQSLNNLAELYRSAGPLRRGRAALQARARHPREGAGPRPPRRRHQPQQPGRAVPRARAATPRPSRSTSARSPSARRRWAPSHPTVGRVWKNQGQSSPAAEQAS